MNSLTDILICASSEIEEGGLGKRFPVMVRGDDATGFVVRYGGAVYGYLNRCAHVPVELDWSEGEFFESSGLYLMCATHGAVYSPDTGKCEGGPCTGAHLRKIMTVEREGHIYWRPDDIVKPVEA
ncbi:Rieske (2Fe-2S) protein [Herbaspirillum sp. WKF16]|uniref:Rieske (2Fe-2S) protein n=1 Tax=Herbaspirillum sp. WKF16 TaxID=3028312 RepID=UPI0023A967D2|nr:Rieske (2Fe-2S) protein [Herbaspirillum sp. WKF16]WDZ97818.1 Rieske (2Fe-2S) protein [Herbaspirillum sp. WKF16]